MAHDRPNVCDLGRVIAHRGASLAAPENTLGAFRLAATQGATWIEFDVSLLGDETPVIHHDATLDRCTTHRGPLDAIGVADLAVIQAGANEPLATLDAALDLIEQLGLFANLEMKPHDRAPGVLARVVGQALAARPWTADRILTSSFALTELSTLRRMLPHAPLAVLYHRPAADWPQVLARLKAAALHLHFSYLSQSLLSRARRERVDVRVFTINRPQLMLPFRNIGLTGVITDHPPLFLQDPDWADWITQSNADIEWSPR